MKGKVSLKEKIRRSEQSLNEKSDGVLYKDGDGNNFTMTKTAVGYRINKPVVQ
ncbi:hypothetical protein CPT_Magnus_028 [Klebsiella phage Magnus]|uniref:Uncharacterized protein n=3 Tax=Taipeivirus TaxID=2731621 RepID=A0A5Q2F763_9CAUD|nr:hypothetical protein HOS54_gp214 [Klebsiella phage Menlow]YP_009883441.1 hypothetical protein HYP92_gp211 [Klebsiella phage Magnus]YP_009884723.1 hypothetical protein HYQ02_gp212 [Klebsiella phage UPM 2146]AUG87735.1 hypothetical protein CPT_Menlow_032 [Klebsiella phage Menlow]QEG07909.1 hypothetical protein CPT_Magnus_028 [Klebsiella phage Magnus]QGF20647.1 hypothetical protein [Klebsiella phage UPM 2146]